MAVYVKRSTGVVALHEISVGAVVGIAVGGAVVLGVFVVVGIFLVLQWKCSCDVANATREATIQRRSSMARPLSFPQASQLPDNHNHNGKRSGWAKLSSNENLRDMSRKARSKLLPQMSQEGSLPMIENKLRRKRSSDESDDAIHLPPIHESYILNSRPGQRADQAFEEMRLKTSHERRNPNPRYSQGLPVPESKIIPGLKPSQFSLYPSPHLSAQRKIRCTSLPALLDIAIEKDILDKPLSPTKTVRRVRSRSFGAVNLSTAPLGPLPPLPTGNRMAKRNTIRKVSTASALSIASTDSLFQNAHDIHQLGVTPNVPAKKSPHSPSKYVRIAKDLPAVPRRKGDSESTADSPTRPDRPILRIRTIIGASPDASPGRKQLPLLPTKATTTPAIAVQISDMYDAPIMKSNVHGLGIHADNVSNPIDWSPKHITLDSRPSAMKGSPTSRKTHKRQNCQRIKVDPTFFGPPSRTPSSSRICSIIEESPESSTAKSCDSRTGIPGSTLPHRLSLAKPPTSTTFSPDLKMNQSSRRAPFDSSSHDIVTFAKGLHDLQQSEDLKDSAKKLNKDMASSVASQTLPPTSVTSTSQTKPSRLPTATLRPLRHRRSASSSTLRFSQAIDPEDLIVESTRSSVVSSVIFDESELPLFVETNTSPPIKIPGLTLIGPTTPCQPEFQFPTLDLQSSPPRISREFETWSDVSCVPSPLIFTPKKTGSIPIFPSSLLPTNKSSPTTKVSQLPFPVMEDWSSQVTKKQTNPFDRKPDFSPKHSRSIPQTVQPRLPKLNGPRDAPAQNLRKSVKSLRAMASDNTLSDTSREQRRYLHMGREASPEFHRDNSPCESMISLSRSVWEDGENFWQQENAVQKESPLVLRLRVKCLAYPPPLIDAGTLSATIEGASATAPLDERRHQNHDANRPASQVNKKSSGKSERSQTKQQTASPPKHHEANAGGTQSREGIKGDSGRRLRRKAEKKMGGTQGDDTQTNEDDLYRTYQANKPSPQKVQKHREQATDDATARTYATNETGFVDLLGDLEEEDVIQGELLDEEGSADELAGPETQGTLGTINLTSPTRFSPITPGYAALKRVVSTEVLERTPVRDLASLFDIKPNEGLLRPSQLFAQTQATGSPPPIITRSDPVYERPSPDFRDVLRSSQAAPLSSPVMFRGPGRRAVTEPRDDYVSLIESQERRSSKVNGNDLSSSGSEEEDELNEDSAQRRAQRQRDRLRLKERALSDFGGLLAPISPRKTHVRGKLPTPRAVTRPLIPAHLPRKRDVVVISDNPSIPEQGDISDADSNDEYDELSQQIVSSDRVMGDSVKVTRIRTCFRADGMRVSHSPSPALSGNRVEEDEDIELPDLPDPGIINKEPQISSIRRQETVNVLNSQPEKGSTISSIPSRLVLPSSIDSRLFISQSQNISGSAKPQLFETPVKDIVDSSTLSQPAPVQSSDLQSIEQLVGRPATDIMHINSSPPDRPQVSINEDAMDTRSDGTHQLMHLSQPLSNSHGISDNHKSSNDIPHSNSQPNPVSTYKPQPPRRRITYAVPDTSPLSSARSDNGSISAKMPNQETTEVPILEPSIRYASATDDQAGQSNSHVMFATAQTHQSPSPQKSQPSRPQESPEGPQFGRMGDMAGSFRSTDPAENIDINIDILNDDDFQVIAALSSPPRPLKKRKITTYGRAGARNSARKETSRKVSPALPIIRDLTPPTVNIPRRLVRVNSPPSSPPIRQLPDASTPLTELSNTPSPVKPAPHTARVGLLARLEIAETPQALIPKATTRRPAVAPLRSIPKAKNSLLKSAKPSQEKSMQKAVDPTPTSPPAVRGRKQRREEVMKAVPQISTPRTSVSPAATGKTFEDICAPRRVLARFMGTKMAYYPATCLGFSSTSTTTLRVRFDDGTEDDVHAHLVKTLDLRVDDLVKVDHDKMRKDTYLVKGFKNRIDQDTVEAERYLKTDVKGHESVLLEVKSRASLPATAATERSEVVEVALTSIYVTNSMWVHFKDREYIHPTKLSSTSAQPQTPIGHAAAPTTPASRTRRGTAVSSTIVTVSGAPSIVETRADLFLNMAFAVTFSNVRESEKSHVTKLILEHGGRILADGYDELFSLSASTNVSPSTSPHRSTAITEPKFELTTTAADLGFTALIADTHSRRAKYIQALALNLPCLSGKWIIDCCKRKTILAWDSYLLPAGESAYLDDAVRSRTFIHQPSYNAAGSSAALQHAVTHRNKLLQDKSVILVVGKGKAEEKRKAYVFLTYALGAKRVARVRDLAAAKKMLDDESAWDWVYVDDGKVDEARAELLGEKKTGLTRLKGTKRKRDSVVNDEQQAAGRNLKVVGDEFVVQSLIFGALVEGWEMRL